MEKIKFIADSASDIPDEALLGYNIDMPGIPIVIDGKEYYERKSFTIREFYKVLGKTTEIPVTSRVPESDYVNYYKKALDQGYTDVINVTINARGSGTNQSAQMAAGQFYKKYPEAKDKLNIHVVDSKTYSAAYGFPVIEGAKMAMAGKSVKEILAYMNNWFDCCEIYLACYTLEYAKKSGRITAAAAFVGDILGLRPIISFLDGDTKVVERVRGEKNVIPELLDMYERHCEDPNAPVFVICGEVPEYGAQLQQALQKRLGREIPVYYAGASIVINSGPRIAAVAFKGKKRK